MEKMDDKIESPKIEIINHFDNLIQRVDIDIENSLEKYNEKQVIGDLKCYKTKETLFLIRRRIKNRYYLESFNLFESLVYYSCCKIEKDWLKMERNLEEEMLSRRKTNETNEKPYDLEYDKIYKTVDLWSDERKVVDYLNQIRMKTIEELRKAQKEALENYKSQSDDLKVSLEGQIDKDFNFGLFKKRLLSLLSINLLFYRFYHILNRQVFSVQNSYFFLCFLRFLTKYFRFHMFYSMMIYLLRSNCSFLLSF